uniref:Uncharacterized protein n=1 Tax=Rhizophora mucronata TaxID=61149 RepID=A0A2P2ILR0_RHIMU
MNFIYYGCIKQTIIKSYFSLYNLNLGIRMKILQVTRGC